MARRRWRRRRSRATSEGDECKKTFRFVASTASSETASRVGVVGWARRGRGRVVQNPAREEGGLAWGWVAATRASEDEDEGEGDDEGDESRVNESD